MAINLKIKVNSTPSAIVAAIKTMIDNGEIDTWSYDVDGDFTHSPKQWMRRSWFRPEADDDNGTLSFWIIGNKNEVMTKTMYAIYHGRFVEMLLKHFDNQIDSFIITPERGLHDSFH